MNISRHVIMVIERCERWPDHEPGLERCPTVAVALYVPLHARFTTRGRLQKKSKNVCSRSMSACAFMVRALCLGGRTNAVVETWSLTGTANRVDVR